MSRSVPNTRVGAVVLLPLLLLGCGGGGGGEDASGSSETTAVADAADQASFQACLAEHGIEIPEAGEPGAPPTEGGPAGGGRPPSDGTGAGPGDLPEGVTQEDVRTAMEQCGGGQPEDVPGLSELEAYGSCLGDHGVTVEGGGDGPPRIDRDDPDFAAADEACAALRPTMPSTSTTSPSKSATVAAP